MSYFRTFPPTLHSFKMLIDTINESFPPKSTFVPERDIPDLTGKVAIVTGGNAGLGKETVKHLLAHNAKVYMASRSKTRAEAAIEELKTETGKEAIFLELNLANLDAVTRAANEFKSKESELHILYNSAGVMNTPVFQLTDDGYDMQFGTNVLGHAHLTLLLIPELAAGAKSSPDHKARVVNISSFAAYQLTHMEWRSLIGSENPALREKVGVFGLYAQSKFGNAVLSHQLAQHYADQGIVSNALNPGNIRTDISREWTGVQRRVFLWLFKPISLGGLTPIWAGTAPEAANYNGAWFRPWARVGHWNSFAKAEAEGDKLWEWIEEQRKTHL